MLGLSEKTVTKAMNDLKKFNLVEEQRRGLGKPNLIYLLTVENLDFSKNRKIYGSGQVDFTGQKPENFPPNDTEVIDTETSNIQSNPIQSVSDAGNEKIKTDGDGMRADEMATHEIVNVKSPKSIQDYDRVSEEIRENIDYDVLVEDKPTDRDMINEIIHVITSTICANYKDGYVSMGEERIPAKAVKSVFYKLNMFDIQYFMECYNKQTEPITKLTPYIRASLYRNSGTISHHYANRVTVDMRKGKFVGR
jgi:hypothetical protein